jgi:hypothetical protein
MRKASSMLACRQAKRRRRLHLEPAAASIICTRAVAAYHFPAREISRRLNAQLPLQIVSSSACEQAFSRELLLPLTRDTILAAVPWFKFSPKARH